MTVCNVMNQTNKVQLAKNSTNMLNETAYSPITSITFDGFNNTDNFVVYGGNSADNLTAITPTITGTKLTYDFDGATFFKVVNGKGVFTCDSITFEF